MWWYTHTHTDAHTHTPHTHTSFKSRSVPLALLLVSGLLKAVFNPLTWHPCADVFGLIRVNSSVCTALAIGSMRLLFWDPEISIAGARNQKPLLLWCTVESPKAWSIFLAIVTSSLGGVICFTSHRVTKEAWCYSWHSLDSCCWPGIAGSPGAGDRWQEMALLQEKLGAGGLRL